jgi:hypothetical protein
LRRNGIDEKRDDDFLAPLITYVLILISGFPWHHESTFWESIQSYISDTILDRKDKWLASILIA